MHPVNLVNLTPHVVQIADSDGNIIRAIEPTLPSARVASTAVDAGDLDGVPLVQTVFGEVENLPRADYAVAPNDVDTPSNFATYYIVSQIVISALPDRLDLVRPDTGPTCVRDASGKIVAVRALTR